MKNRNKYDIILFLLILFLAFGNIGGALAPTRLLALLFLPLLMQKRKECKYINPFINFFIIFYAFCLFSIAWTPDKSQGFKELVYYPIHFLYFFEILVFSKFAKNPLYSICWGWAIMVFLCSFIALWELTTDNHLSMAVQETGDVANTGTAMVQHLTASVTFANPNSYVTELCYSFPWIVYLLMSNEKGLWKNSILMFTVLVTLIVILFNMSRGGLLSFMIMGIVFFLLSPKSLGKTMISLFISLVIIYVLINYGSDVLTIMEMRTSDGGLTHDDARSAIWIVCLQLLVNSMFIGVGVGGITAALGAASKNIVASPHSLFFEILVQYGVVFTIVIVVFYIRLLKSSWRLKERIRRTVLLMSLVALPVYTIINSGYLLGTDLFALIGTMYIFIHIDRISIYNQKNSLLLQEK